MPKALDLTGKRFGKLVAIKKVPSKNKKTYWLCQCDCGNQKEIQTSHLQSGAIQSCGCLVKENSKREYEFCLNCGIKLHKGQYKYCSNSCQAQYERNQKVENIFNEEESGLKGENNYYPKIKNSLRLYLLEQANYCCEECGCNWINPFSNQTILEIHHIDGDRKNNTKENLKVLCPNCHAMTKNYKGLNKKN